MLVRQLHGLKLFDQSVVDVLGRYVVTQVHFAEKLFDPGVDEQQLLFLLTVTGLWHIWLYLNSALFLLFLYLLLTK